MISAKMQPVAPEAAPCTGFSQDIYNRYVLGLLDGQERAQVDQQVEQRCAACISGVQRSMNLWLVFANSMEHTEPAADFRGRLVRIAELSNRVLTVPKRHRRVREPAILISSLVIVSIILGTLLIFTWIAGRQSARMDAERTNAELQRLTRELTDKQTTVQQQAEQIRALDGKQTPSGPSTVAQQKKLEDSLSKAQAAVAQYKAIIARETEQSEDNSKLTTALATPGARLLTFKNAEGVVSTAYALVVEGSKIVVVASNLAALPDGSQYQLWIVRKDEPRYVTAGMFSPAEDKPVVVTYSEDKDAITNMAGLLVTVEPLNGSTEPKGTKFMETPGATAVTTSVSAPE